MMPDPEVLCVAWARANTAIAAINGNRCASRLPLVENWGGPTFLRAFALPGVVLLQETSDLAMVTMQFDCYAITTTPNPDYAVASSLARTLVAESELAQSVYLATGEIVSFGVPITPRRIEESDNRWARFTTEVPVVIRP